MIKKTVLANRRCITSLAAMKRSTWKWAEARTTSPPSSTTVSGKPNIAKMPQPWKDKTHRRQCIMSSYKKWPFKGVCGRCLSVLGPEPHTRPPYTLYMYMCIQYTYSYKEGREGGRVEPDRRLEGQLYTKLGRKYQHDWLYLQSINSDKKLNIYRKVPLQAIFYRWRHFALTFMSLIFLRPQRSSMELQWKYWRWPRLLFLKYWNIPDSSVPVRCSYVLDPFKGSSVAD